MFFTKKFKKILENLTQVNMDQDNSITENSGLIRELQQKVEELSTRLVRTQHLVEEMKRNTKRTKPNKPTKRTYKKKGKK